EAGAAGGGPAPPHRWRVAFAAALTPDGAPNAQWNFDLLQALTGRADVEVHAFADRPPGAGRERRPLVAPPGVPVHPLASLEAVESLRGPFDAVVYALADDEHHTGCLAALRRRRDGVVVAHQVALSDLYGHAARSGALAAWRRGGSAPASACRAGDSVVARCRWLTCSTIGTTSQATSRCT